MLNNISDKIIKDSYIFDYYENKKLENFKLGYRFIFQSQYKTLTDIEINKKVKDILDPILKIKGVQIPGLSI